LKYICENGHTFTHPAKKITPMFPAELITHLNTLLEAVPDDKDLLVLAQLFVEMKKVFSEGSFETFVCPYTDCHNVKFSEFIEPIEELEDVISVEYVNVGAKIAEGYKVKEIYAKSVTLVKPKKRVEGDYIQEAMEKAKVVNV
jgi:hypothetical protein